MQYTICYIPATGMIAQYEPSGGKLDEWANERDRSPLAIVRIDLSEEQAARLGTQAYQDGCLVDVPQAPPWVAAINDARDTP